MKQKPNHDLLVRKYLTDKEAAKDFLLAHLPVEILNICDLDSIIVEPTSYIEDDLREHCSDIVHKLKIKKSKKTAYIYTLVENQIATIYDQLANDVLAKLATLGKDYSSLIPPVQVLKTNH